MGAIALDERRIGLAGIYGAAGTFCTSTGFSILSSAILNRGGPASAWKLYSPLLVAGTILLAVAYWNWSRGTIPKPPRKTLTPVEAMRLFDEWFPGNGYEVFEAALVQGASEGRFTFWGREREPSWLDAEAPVPFDDGSPQLLEEQRTLTFWKGAPSRKTRNPRRRTQTSEVGAWAYRKAFLMDRLRKRFQRREQQERRRIAVMKKARRRQRASLFDGREILYCASRSSPLRSAHHGPEDGPSEARCFARARLPSGDVG